MVCAIMLIGYMGIKRVKILGSVGKIVNIF
jgi:hypothetical protein